MWHIISGTGAEAADGHRTVDVVTTDPELPAGDVQLLHQLRLQLVDSGEGLEEEQLVCCWDLLDTVEDAEARASADEDGGGQELGCERAKDVHLQETDLSYARGGFELLDDFPDSVSCRAQHEDRVVSIEHTRILNEVGSTSKFRIELVRNFLHSDRYVVIIAH
jgi:hypothetical protein